MGLPPLWRVGEAVADMAAGLTSRCARRRLRSSTVTSNHLGEAGRYHAR
jgi:hypothetical protein